MLTEEPLGLEQDLESAPAVEDARADEGGVRTEAVAGAGPRPEPMLLGEDVEDRDGDGEDADLRREVVVEVGAPVAEEDRREVDAGPFRDLVEERGHDGVGAGERLPHPGLLGELPREEGCEPHAAAPCRESPAGKASASEAAGWRARSRERRGTTRPLPPKWTSRATGGRSIGGCASSTSHGWR